jgi:AcrR family transcriptional regulator
MGRCFNGDPVGSVTHRRHDTRTIRPDQERYIRFLNFFSNFRPCRRFGVFAGGAAHYTPAMTIDRPISLRERNRLRNRQELLNALLDLFAGGGLSACSVEAAARQAGASKTTAYSYFPGGLDEMLRDLYRSIGERVLERGLELRAGAADAEGRILALGRALLDICAEPRVGRFYMMLSPALSPLLEPVIGETSGRFTAMIAEDLAGLGWTPDLAGAGAILVNGSLREAATAVAREPARRAPLLAAFTMILRAALSAGAATATAKEAG